MRPLDRKSSLHRFRWEQGVYIRWTREAKTSYDKRAVIIECIVNSPSPTLPMCRSPLYSFLVQEIRTRRGSPGGEDREGQGSVVRAALCVPTLHARRPLLMPVLNTSRVTESSPTTRQTSSLLPCSYLPTCLFVPPHTYKYGGPDTSQSSRPKSSD